MNNRAQRRALFVAIFRRTGKHIKLKTCATVTEKQCSKRPAVFMNICSVKTQIGNHLAAEYESFCWCFEMFILIAKAEHSCFREYTHARTHTHRYVFM